MELRTKRSRTLWTVLLAAAGSLAASGCFGHYTYVGFGTAVDVLPVGYVTLTVGSVPYYYHRGIFYRPYRRGYVVVPAPMGAMVVGPPPGAALVLVAGAPYHYHYGVFYARRGGRYAVVRPPVGAFVRRLPEGAVTRRVGGVEYKEFAGAYYRPAIRDGRRGYMVSEPPPRR